MPLDPRSLFDALRAAGVREFAGVPCSILDPIVIAAEKDPTVSYMPASVEGEAVAIAAGAWLGGSLGAALLQNSGLGNAVNPITSMLYIYKMPVVLLVSHRGEPGKPDEPQHELMGQITEQLSELCGLRTHVFDPERFPSALQEIQRDSLPTAFIVRKGRLEGGPKAPPISIRVTTRGRMPDNEGTFTPVLTREQALGVLAPLLNSGLDGSNAAAVVATTGKLSRELWELDDRDDSKANRFYMVGSMGCAAGFGLGIARAQPKRPVVILDGDGALLMKLGTLATIGSLAPSNLHHIVLDNGAHESTGGQPTPSPAVDFALMALAAGYKHAATVSDPKELLTIAERQMAVDGPTLLRVLITTGARDNLGRPKLSPRDNYLRFEKFLNGKSA